MGWTIIAFKTKEEMTNQNLLKALKEGKIDRIDVTRSDVLNRMPKTLVAIGNMYNESLGTWYESSEKTSHRRKSIGEMAEEMGYFKEYEKILNSIPIDFNKMRENLSKHEVRSMETDEVIGYGYLKRDSIPFIKET